MVRHYVRKSGRKYFSVEYVQQALNEVKLKKCTIRSIARIYGIPHSTLQRKIKLGSLRTSGRQMTFNVEEEKELVALIKEISNIYQGVTRDFIRKIAYLYAEKKKIYHTFSKKDEKAGVDWLYSFLRRNPSVSSTIKSKNSAGLNEKDISNLFEETFKNINVLFSENLNDRKFENIEIKEENIETLTGCNVNSEEMPVLENNLNNYDLFVTELDNITQSENNVCAEILNETSLENSLKNNNLHINRNKRSDSVLECNCSNSFRDKLNLKEDLINISEHSLLKGINSNSQITVFGENDITMDNQLDFKNEIERIETDVRYSNYMSEKYKSFTERTDVNLSFMNKDMKVKYVETALKSQLLKKKLINLKIKYLKNKLAMEYT